jgi:TPR repeat protein
VHRLGGWIVAAACASIGLSVDACTAQANGTDAAAARAQGLLEYEIGHYTEAVGHFRTAAEAGDVRSAEILCLMYRLGSTVYGERIEASRSQAARWAALAADGQLAIATAPGMPRR